MKKYMIFIFALILSALLVSGCGIDDVPVSQTICILNTGMQSPDSPVDGQWRGDYIYLGEMKWRLLSVQDSKMFLLLDDSPEDLMIPCWTGGPGVTDYRPNWKDSYVRQYLNTTFLETAFSAEEQQIMRYTRISDQEECSDKLRLFSYAFYEKDLEAFGLGETGNELTFNESWWATWGIDSFLKVEADGSYEYDEDIPYEEELSLLARTDTVARPICNIIHNDILYSKDASLPISPNVSSVLSLPEEQESASGEWSLVLSSTSQHVDIDDVSLEGNVCTFHYSNATTGEGNGLTAVIRNHSYLYVYTYQKIADTSTSDSGTVQLQLPDFFNRECDLQIFSERERTSPTGTGYGSEPVTILNGKRVTEGTLRSEGLLTPDYTPLPIDPVISHYYDSYLFRLDYETFQNADEESLLEAATAVLLYQAVLSGQLKENAISNREIDDAEDYVKAHSDEALVLARQYFQNMEQMGAANVKEAMDHANEFTNQELSAPTDMQSVDIGEYTQYLSCTYEQYLSADSTKQRQIMMAGLLYLAKYRLNKPFTEEEAAMNADNMTESIEMMWELSPDATMKELMDQS